MIHKRILLPCPRAAAFELFTARISEWWPAERRHTSDAQSLIVLEASGRFFERDRAGTEVELGAVRLWEPPQRLVLDWFPGTDREHPTRVEVTFTPQANQTLVEVRHSATAASEALFPTRAARYEASWTLVLAALAAAASPHSALDNK